MFASAMQSGHNKPQLLVVCQSE